MIFSTMTPEKKKKINRWIMAIGLLALVLGFIPGLLAYQWGIVIFIFSLVASGIVKIIIPEPEPQESPPLDAEQNQLDKIFKTEEAESKTKTDDAV